MKEDGRGRKSRILPSFLSPFFLHIYPKVREKQERVETKEKNGFNAPPTDTDFYSEIERERGERARASFKGNGLLRNHFVLSNRSRALRVRSVQRTDFLLSIIDTSASVSQRKKLCALLGVKVVHTCCGETLTFFNENYSRC